MDRNDPDRHDDPLWYDRAEPAPAPGRLLAALAYLILLAMAGAVTLLHLYRLPDTLWCRAAARIQARNAAQSRRS